MKDSMRVVRIKPGSAAYDLLQMIAVCGEYPVRGRHLIGGDNAMRHLITRMQAVDQVYALYAPDNTCIEYTGRLISVVKPAEAFQCRSIRLTKGGRYALSIINPEAYEYYDRENRSNRQCTRDSLMRACRLAESIAMAASAGCEYRPYRLPVLNSDDRQHIIFDHPAFYSSRVLRGIHQYDDIPEKKATISRLTGMLVSPANPYAVYHTLEYVMKWNGNAERRKKTSLEYIAAINWGEQRPVNSCILFSWDAEVIAETMIRHESHRDRSGRITAIYEHIHWVPADRFGVKLLSTLMIPGGRDRILNIVFGQSAQSCMCGHILADMQLGDTYYWTFFDGDITRLWELKRRLEQGIPNNLVITCYDGQESLLQSVLPAGITLKRLHIEAVLDEINKEGQI